MRLALGHYYSGVKHNDLVAEGKHFLAIVGDEENRNSVMLVPPAQIADQRDRKSTRLNSSHLGISYAVFCLKKKKLHHHTTFTLVVAHAHRLFHTLLTLP